MTASNVIIIGAGMSGVASAIAISKAVSASALSKVDGSLPQITICELRDKPSTIGGAVNLTPSALRCLDIVGVLDEIKSQQLGCETKLIQLYSLHTAGNMGMIDYRGHDGNGIGGYYGMRIPRGDLLTAMLSVVEGLSNVRIEYGKRLTGIAETEESVVVDFADGTNLFGDMVLGCDGIHSAVRTKFLEPDRVPVYSGVASAYGFLTDKTNHSTLLELKSQIQAYFNDVSLAMAQRGAILTAFCDAARSRLYVAALMGSEKQIDKDGWRALGSDKEAVKKDVSDRFEQSALPYMQEVVRWTDDWFLYPVYMLRPEGKWFTKRVLLLGDAAHAVCLYDLLPSSRLGVDISSPSTVCFVPHISVSVLSKLAFRSITAPGNWPVPFFHLFLNTTLAAQSILVSCLKNINCYSFIDTSERRINRPRSSRYAHLLQILRRLSIFVHPLYFYTILSYGPRYNPNHFQFVHRPPQTADAACSCRSFLWMEHE